MKFIFIVEISIEKHDCKAHTSVGFTFVKPSFFYLNLKGAIDKGNRKQ